MDYITHCASPLGGITLAADEGGLIGLWFDSQRHFGSSLSAERREGQLPVFDQTVRWLEEYFAGRVPDFTPALHPRGTPFQQAVWSILLTIPYGQTRTYGEIALQMGIPRMSAQAVGGAVGRNPISLIIPCHRVLGAGGSLTGYAAGLERKLALLQLEGSYPGTRPG